MTKKLRLNILLTLVLTCLIASCTSKHQITDLPSSNYSFRVKSLVIHFTAVNYEQSLQYLVNEGGGVSSHYLIPQLNDETYPYDRIKVMKLVDEKDRAWHAGRSYWQGRSGLNDSSIGIEIVNQPECIESEVPEGFIKPKALCIYPEFESRQIDLLIDLIQDILSRNPDITPTAIVGHSDIAPSRKNDPGPRFPWQQLYEAGIGAWYDKDTVAKYWSLFSERTPSIGIIQKALSSYGYKIDRTGVIDRQSQDVIGAFQMHFIPWQVSYQADSKTAATIFALLDKYFPDQLADLLEQYENETLFVNDNKPDNNNQLNMVFTQPDSQLNNERHNRYAFVASKNSGVMHIRHEGITSADVFVNDQKLNLGEFFSDQPEQNKQAAESFSIAKRTVHGLNTIRVDNLQVSPQFESPTLTVSIPYPSITFSDENAANYDFSRVDALLKQDIQQGFPGANILVLHKGKVVKHKAYGFARKYADGGGRMAIPEVMSLDTRFDLASNTKVFATTMAIMKLVDEGKLSLTDPLSNYLVEYDGDGRDTRTIADLLSHASGYNSEVQLFKSDNALGERFFSQEKMLTSEVLLNDLPFSYARRSQQVYSDTNFMILGLLVERISGQALDEYVETQIFEPLGLVNTRFVPLEKGFTPSQFAATEIQGNTRGGRILFDNVRDYVLQGEVHDEKAYYSMQGVAGHAGLFSNTYDLAVLSQLLLNGGGYNNQTLFSEQTLQRFVHPEYIQDSIGLGWRLASSDTQWHFGPYASAHAFGHTGWTGTAVVIDPALDLAIIYLTNKRHSVVDEQNGQFVFAGNQYKSASYGNIMSLVYEAVIAAEYNKK